MYRSAAKYPVSQRHRIFATPPAGVARRPVQQLRGDWAGILVRLHQVRGQGDAAVGPERDMRPVRPLPLLVVHGRPVPYTSTSELSRSIVAAVNNWVRRRADTNPSTRALTTPMPFSIPARCVAVKRFASRAVVADANVGTARPWWSTDSSGGLIRPGEVVGMVRLTQ
jgi:hypothetical protein